MVSIVTVFITAITLHLAEIVLNLFAFFDSDCVELCYWNAILLATITTSTYMRVFFV